MNCRHIKLWSWQIAVMTIRPCDNIVWWKSFGRWKLSLNFPYVHPALNFALFSFLTERKVDWTCLHFALFSPFHFSFHRTSSLCIQLRIKGSVCKPWTWMREKLVGHVYTLHFFKVDLTCLYFALFQSWLDMFTFCTFLSISFFLSLNFFFVHPASHKRLCLQSLDLA